MTLFYTREKEGVNVHAFYGIHEITFYSKNFWFVE